MTQISTGPVCPPKLCLQVRVTGSTNSTTLVDNALATTIFDASETQIVRLVVYGGLFLYGGLVVVGLVGEMRSVVVADERLVLLQILPMSSKLVGSVVLYVICHYNAHK